QDTAFCVVICVGITDTNPAIGSAIGRAIAQMREGLFDPRFSHRYRPVPTLRAPGHLSLVAAEADHPQQRDAGQKADNQSHNDDVPVNCSCSANFHSPCWLRMTTLADCILPVLASNPSIRREQTQLT